LITFFTSLIVILILYTTCLKNQYLLKLFIDLEIFRAIAPSFCDFATLRLYIIKKIPGAVAPGFASLRSYIDMKNKKIGLCSPIPLIA